MELVETRLSLALCPGHDRRDGLVEEMRNPDGLAQRLQRSTREPSSRWASCAQPLATRGFHRRDPPHEPRGSGPGRCALRFAWWPSL